MAASEVDEQRRIPDVDGVKAMLQRYFVGPITDEVAVRLQAHVVATLGDQPRLAGIVSAFHPANGRRGYGLAWREELAFGRTWPRSIDLAAWLAWTTAGSPPARPYCPDVYVGTWRQLEPAGAARWELALDGTFTCDEERFKRRKLWRVHRHKADNHVGESIWLDDELGISPASLVVDDVTPTELRVAAIGGAFADVPYRLRRE